MADILLVAIECRLCTALFVMCLSCYRGHAYCGDKCRGKAREKQNRRARAEHLRQLGPEEVRKANKERKARQRESRSRQSEAQGGVTDQAPNAEGEPVGSEQLDRGSQGANAAAEPGAGRAPDQAPEQASEPIVDPGFRPAEMSSEPDGIAQTLGQPSADAPADSDMAVAADEQICSDKTAATDEQVGHYTVGSDAMGGDTMAPTDEVDGDTMVATDEHADVDLRWQPHPKAVPSRCSCCGKPGWLVPWVLRARSRPRSLRHLLAKGGPRGCQSRQ